MNRNLCVLSTSRGRPFLIAARYQDGVLMIARAEEIRAKTIESEGKRKQVVSVDDLVNKELAEYHRKGYAVAVDEDMPRYSIPYQHTPLITGEEPILVEAYRAYMSLSDNKVVFKAGITEIRCKDTLEVEIGDGGKATYRVDGDAFTNARAAMLLVAYHALNVDITDIGFMRTVFGYQRERRLQAPKVRR
ncbi:hypothetical protein NTE19_003338 [Vibrio fluvialis]|nr:hypothetical protein [Vibrio fluvialis]